MRMRYSSSSLSLLRNIVARNDWPPLSHVIHQTLLVPAAAYMVVSSKPFHYFTFTNPESPRHQLPTLLSRNFSSSSSSSSSGPSNIVVIDSEETFNNSLRKVQDEALPAIWYFTAAWCGPCRLLSPIISQLSEKYPHVTTYKVDIDKEALGKKLSELDIRSVPTLHFFKDGKKDSEVIGADVERVKHTMAKLYE